MIRASLVLAVAVGAAPAGDAATGKQLLAKLDAPLLFTKRHSYKGIHIYDIFYKWPPGGGGIYVLENPRDSREDWKIRTVIDERSPNSLGTGVYTDPDISRDARKLLFCYKGEPKGCTKIYEINIDGTGLRQVTDPAPCVSRYRGRGGGHHDISPAYLPDGRIVFLSTRAGGLVPCNNTGVAIMHVMNADGTDLRPISVNSENEFDPTMLPDGRILFGRWEYVDKNALTVQSLWTINPDGSEETAMYANNMVFPEATLDGRPVPGTSLIALTLAKHNSTPRGSIAYLDPLKGKNAPAALFNFEHPDNPTYDRGDSCEPWPLDADTVLFSGRPKGAKRNAIRIMDRAGRRITVLSDPAICLHAPMLIKPRAAPPVRPDLADRDKRTGRFFVQNIYDGLDGVEKGEVTWLRIIEETSRVSRSPGTRNPFNQTFLVSAALAFAAKIYHGMVPVNEDGSVYFEAPAGRALYFQALDEDKRLVQSMRTFFQAVPGRTRACIGCHEKKSNAPDRNAPTLSARALKREPERPRPESWGTGYLDYPSMIQPIWDRHCVSCHGGEKGFAARLDLTGGWTKHFNNSYENLADRRETQLIAHLIAGIDCMNGTAHWSCRIFPPRGHGSAIAPLAEVVASGHKGRIRNMTDTERDLVMAWIDSNGLYYGNWDYTAHGYGLADWDGIRKRLTAEMAKAGCSRCHKKTFAGDWINLENPAYSRILRAPLAKGGTGHGAALCRDHPMDPRRRRLRLLRNGYAHAVKPLKAFAKQPVPPIKKGGTPAITFASTADPHYRAMRAVIRDGRRRVLAKPRVDMPGAAVIAGKSRMFIPPPVPAGTPGVEATVDESAVVRVSWRRSAATIGLSAEVHRAETKNFTPSADTRIAETTLFHYRDLKAPPGTHHYAVILTDGDERSAPACAAADVPETPPPAAPVKLAATPGSYYISLAWEAGSSKPLTYHVYRGRGDGPFEKITAEPVGARSFTDTTAEPGVTRAYRVRAVDRRGAESEPSNTASAAAKKTETPVFSIDDDVPFTGKTHGKAAVQGAVLDFRRGGHATIAHRRECELARFFAVECWVNLDRKDQMPVLLSAGRYARVGWFLQAISGRWRWHADGVSCDGGTAVAGKWVHLAATLEDGHMRLYQDGRQVATTAGPRQTGTWGKGLFIGQYSGAPGPPYQVTGRIADVKIYHRPLKPAEIAKKAQTPPVK